MKVSFGNLKPDRNSIFSCWIQRYFKLAADFGCVQARNCCCGCDICVKQGIRWAFIVCCLLALVIFLGPFLQNFSSLLKIFIFFEKTDTNKIFNQIFIGFIVKRWWWNHLNSNIFYHPFGESKIFLEIRFTAQINFFFYKNEWKSKYNSWTKNWIINKKTNQNVTNLRWWNIHLEAKPLSFQ